MYIDALAFVYFLGIGSAVFLLGRLYQIVFKESDGCPVPHNPTVSECINCDRSNNCESRKIWQGLGCGS